MADLASSEPVCIRAFMVVAWNGWISRWCSLLVISSALLLSTVAEGAPASMFEGPGKRPCVRTHDRASALLRQLLTS